MPLENVLNLRRLERYTRLPEINLIQSTTSEELVPTVIRHSGPESHRLSPNERGPGKSRLTVSSCRNLPLPIGVPSSGTKSSICAISSAFASAIVPFLVASDPRILTACAHLRRAGGRYIRYHPRREREMAERFKIAIVGSGPGGLSA